MDNIEKQNKGQDVGDEKILFQWNYRIKMLFNPILWKNFVLVFGLPIFLLGVAFMMTGKVMASLFFMGGAFVFFALVWGIAGVVIDLAGGFHASFLITSNGIAFTSGKSEKTVADSVAVIGALAGSASAAGAGLLAKSEQDAFIGWDEIRKVKVRKGMRYILIRKGFGSKPIGLYCTAENFSGILELVKTKCTGRGI